MNPARPPTASTPAPAATAQKASDASARPQVVAFAAAVGRTSQAARLYETQHPLVQRAAASACEALREACGASAANPASALTLGIGPERLFDGDASFSDPPECQALAHHWHGRDLGQATFASNLSAEALLHAIRLWLSPDHAQPKALASAIVAATHGGVTLEPVRYDRVRSRDTAQSARRSAWTWRTLFDDVFDAGSDEAQWASSCDALIDQLEAAIHASADEALHGLHTELHGALLDAVEEQRSAAGAAEGQGSGGVRTTVHRLGRLLEAVSPALRQRLLVAAGQACPGSDQPQAGSEHDFAAVLAAVHRLDGTLSSASQASLLMCQKLAGLSRSLGGSNEPASPGDESLIGSLEELLNQHDPAEFTPDAYRQRLQEIAGGGTAADPAGARLRAAFEAESVRAHAFELALHLATAGDDAPGPEAWSYLRRQVGPLGDSGRIGPLAQVARAAESRLARGGPEETLSACRALLDDLKQTLMRDGRLGELLDRVRSPEDAATLLRHADASVLHEGVRRLADAERDDDAAALAQPLRNLGGPLNTIVEALIAEVPDRRLRLLRRLSPVSFATATRWLGPLLTHKDAARRAEAFSALASACPVWPADVAEGLLQHPDEAVRASALQRLLRQRDPASLAALGRLLTGQSTGRLPAEALVQRAVRAMLGAGDAGVAALRGAIDHGLSLRRGKRRGVLGPMASAVMREAEPSVAASLLPYFQGETS